MLNSTNSNSFELRLDRATTLGEDWGVGGTSPSKQKYSQDHRTTKSDVFISVCFLSLSMTHKISLVMAVNLSFLHYFVAIATNKVKFRITGPNNKYE